MTVCELFQELVIDVCDQTKGHRFYDQFIWSLAIRTDHVGSNVAVLTWRNSDQLKWSQIKISPVQFNRLNGPSPIIWPSILGSWPFTIHIFFSSPLFFGPRPFNTPFVSNISIIFLKLSPSKTGSQPSKGQTVFGPKQFSVFC